MEVSEIWASMPAALQVLSVRRSLLKVTDDAEQQQLNQSLSPDSQSDNLPGASSGRLFMASLLPELFITLDAV